MRSNQYSDHSLHYFHSFAIQNRIDHSRYPDTHPHTCLDQPERRAKSLLPSPDDDAIISSNIATLVSRILAEHMPFFKHTFEDVTDWHIKHQYYKEMSSKSVVVSVNYIKIRGCNNLVLFWFVIELLLISYSIFFKTIPIF